MELFLILLIMFVLIRIVVGMTPKPGTEHSNQITVVRKQCPPHQWFWQEVVDQDGNKYGERIVCKVCGPFKGGSDEN